MKCYLCAILKFILKHLTADFNKTDTMMGQSPATMAAQANMTDTSGNARRMQMSNTQNRVHKEAKARFQVLRLQCM